MKLRVYRALWGVIDETDGRAARSPHRTLETALSEIKALGYDGVEVPFKLILGLGKDKFKAEIEKNDLKVIVMIFTDGPVVPGSGGPFGGPYPGFTKSSEPGETDKKRIVETHLKVFKEQVEAAQEFNPTFVNCHSCKDFFTVEMASEYFSSALAWQKATGYTVHHETHRKRFLHSPWVARDFVPTIPDVSLVADLSHWVAVAETNPSDPDLTQVVEDMAPKVKHVHCRVGYDHGAQVPDPRSPEWLPYMEGHERWWDAIWMAAAANGDLEVTMTPEHGPPTYQICVPGSGEPLANIWDVNHWIALRRQARFAQLFGQENTSSLVPSQTQDEKPVTNPGESVLSGMGRVGFK